MYFKLFETDIKLHPSKLLKLFLVPSCLSVTILSLQLNRETLSTETQRFFFLRNCNFGRYSLYLTKSDSWNLIVSSDKLWIDFFQKARIFHLNGQQTGGIIYLQKAVCEICSYIIDIVALATWWCNSMSVLNRTSDCSTIYRLLVNFFQFILPLLFISTSFNHSTVCNRPADDTNDRIPLSWSLAIIPTLCNPPTHSETTDPLSNLD